MPYLNNYGEWCAGRGGGVVSWGNKTEQFVVSQPAGGTHWLNDDELIFQHCVGAACSIRRYHVRSAANLQAAPRGANTIAAGGGVWAAWLGGYGLYTSTGMLQPESDISFTSVGPDGAIAIKRLRQSYGPWDGWEVNGDKWLLTAGDAGTIHMLGQRRACWIEDGEPKVTDGVPMPNPRSRPFWWLRMLETPLGWWCLYQASDNGNLVMHPVTSTKGYIVTSGEDTFQPDFVLLTTNVIRIVWSIQIGEGPQFIKVRDIDLGEPRVEVGGTPVPSDISVAASRGGAPGSIALTSFGTFGVAGLGLELPVLVPDVVPMIPIPTGMGRITHPTLGRYDYEVKPDEWTNVDAEAIIPPVWSSARTLTSAASVLWPGHLRDVVVEERWKALGGIAMPIEQLRALVAVWTTPVDPATGYVTWSPSYHSGVLYRVIPLELTVGGQGITLDDVVHYKDQRGEDGWVTDPVILTMRLVEKL